MVFELKVTIRPYQLDLSVVSLWEKRFGDARFVRCDGEKVKNIIRWKSGGKSIENGGKLSVQNIFDTLPIATATYFMFNS